MRSNTLRRKLDPRAANGGIFLGLNGVVVKSHGGTDAVGFASALDMAIDMAQADVNRHASPPTARGVTRSSRRPLRHDPLARHRLRRLSAGQHRHQ